MLYKFTLLYNVNIILNKSALIIIVPYILHLYYIYLSNNNFNAKIR